MFLQHCFNALTLGSLYALIAIGYTMVYGILRLINFAHGDILMVGAYFVFFGTFAFGWPWAVAAVVSVAGASLLGVIIERVAYRPLRDAPRISALISAIAVSFFIESLAVVIFTGQPRPVLQPDWLVSEWQIGGLRILPLTAFVPCMTIVLVGILLYMVYRKYCEGDAGFAAGNLIGLLCSEILLLNIPGVIGMGILLWRVWRNVAPHFESWLFERRVMGVLADIAGSLVILVLAFMCATAARGLAGM